VSMGFPFFAIYKLTGQYKTDFPWIVNPKKKIPK